MKQLQFSLWMVCLLCIIFPLDLGAQLNPDRILRNTRNRTERKVEKRIERRIDEAVDKTLDQIEESIGGTGKTEDAAGSPAEGKEGAEPGEAPAAKPTDEITAKANQLPPTTHRKTKHKTEGWSL